MNEFVVKNGLISQGDITGTGSLVVSRNITSSNISASGFVSASIFVGTLTGSLFGTSSWATNSLTASSLVAANSYTITNLTASNISASGTVGFGNVGIGTTSPTGKLDIQGSSVHDLPTYSAEFLSASGWTSTGWTGSFDPPGWTHITGSTNLLYHDKVAVTGSKYQIAYTVTGRTAGSFTIAFGGESIAGVYANGNGAWGPTALSTASLTINPTDTFNGTIVISIKSITGISTSLVNLKSSDGTARVEIRANNALGNTFIGIGAGRYNTTGNYNASNGSYSLLNNTTGYQNTANGYGSLYYNTTGYNNTSNGMYSLLYNTTGYNNTSVGAEALLNNLTGYSNTAVGRVSLYSNTTGYYNVAIGMDSLEFNISGYYNTAIGAISLYSNLTGYNNTSVGYSAGRTLTTGNSNTFLGYNAGFHGSQLTSSVNSMALGNGTYTTADNQVVIGNTGVTQTLLNGSVGIGTTSPAYLLDVSGSSRFGYRSADTHQFTGSISISGSLNATSSWSTNSLTASSLVAASSYTITNLTASNISASATGSFGIVGIGTTTPSQKLTVSGTGTVVGRIESTSNAGARDAQLQLYVGNSGGGDPAGSILFNASASGGEMSYGKIVVANTVSAAAGNGEMQFWTSLSGTATERMRINKDGRVGIGTTVPGALLELSSSTAASLLNIKGAGGNGLLFVSASGNVGIGTTSPVALLTVVPSGSAFDNTNAMAAYFGKNTLSSSGTTFIRVAILNNITTTGSSANYTDIEQNSGGSGPFRYGTYVDTNIINSNASTSGVYGSINLVTSGSARMTIAGGTSAGNVGIGTTSPVNRLDVAGNISCSVITASTFFGTSSWSTNSLTASSLVVGNSYNITNLTASNISASGTGSFNMVGVGTSSPGAILEVSSSTALTVFNVKGAGGANLFTVSGSGNIGVGTTPSTSYKMQINGSFSATTKSFDIDHPVKSGKRLVYGSLESPYHGVRLTGKGKLVKGKGVIQLPDYMNALVDYDNPNVQITNIKHNKVVYVDGIDEKNNIINIAAKIPKTQLNKELEFYWTFTAVRKDVPPLQVEC